MQEGKFIDLHMHSTFSDGQLAPAELIKMASERGLAAVALADHDCLDGNPEYVEAAANANIESITGVELSCVYQGRDLHILGYGVDPADEPLKAMLAKFVEAREQRGIKIVEKLEALGVKIDMEKVFENAGAGALGRPHIAGALVEGGFVKDFNDAFNKYIGEDGPAYVDKYKMSPEDAVYYIHGAGGLAFVAHPGFYMEDLDAFYQLLENGFDGIEVFHSKHKTQTANQLRSIANELGLLESGGSDFHGFAGRDVLGDPKVPFEFFEKIRESLNGRAL
jgi:predicted metal-dependent phosphoesterase TrpH